MHGTESRTAFSCHGPCFDEAPAMGRASAATGIITFSSSWGALGRAAVRSACGLTAVCGVLAGQTAPPL